jgi:hypothetical protein
MSGVSRAGCEGSIRSRHTLSCRWYSGRATTRVAIELPSNTARGCLRVDGRCFQRRSLHRPCGPEHARPPGLLTSSGLARFDPALHVPVLLAQKLELATPGGGWGAVGHATPTAGALRIAGAAGFGRAAGISCPAAEHSPTLAMRLEVVAARPSGSVSGVAAVKATRTTPSIRTAFD